MNETEKRRGRPKAKHSDKQNYTQMLAYVRRDIRTRVKIRLLERGMEFSALVESLLEDWLAKQG